VRALCDSFEKSCFEGIVPAVFHLQIFRAALEDKTSHFKVTTNVHQRSRTTDNRNYKNETELDQCARFET
jgi:hypothetical protein